MSSSDFEDFLLRASDEFVDGGWIFTGFNLPVLAARLARKLGHGFTQVLEAGAAIDRDTDALLTSTTDYFQLTPETCYRGSTNDVMFGIVPRCRRVLLDAANVDVHGRTNSTVIGDWTEPKVRLPGGGGGPDAAYRARHLVLLHAGTQLQRLVAQVDSVTTAPAPDATVRLVTRWGTMSLGERPQLDVLTEGPETEEFLERIGALGVDAANWVPAAVRTPEERKQADEVLEEAREKGYALDQRQARRR